MRVDLQNRIIELDKADIRFDIPLMDELPKGQTFLGTVIEAIPVFNIDSYETYERIRYSDISFKVYKDGVFITHWFGNYNLDSECLLDWQVEKVETGYKVVKGRGVWKDGDIIPFSDIRVLDDHFENCDGIQTLYIAKVPNFHYTELYGNGSDIMRSSMMSSVGIASNKAVFEKSPNYYSGYFTLKDSVNIWSFERGGVSTSKKDFIQKELKDILYWQNQVTKVWFNDEIIFEKEVV